MGLTLLIPAKADAERDRVADEWRTAMGPVVALDKFWEPPPLDPSQARLYGNDTFCLVVAQVLNLQLVTPRDDWLVQFDRRELGRELSVVPLGSADSITFPKFIKPLVPKQFAAGVHQEISTLAAETEGLETETQLLVADVVDIAAEVRCFVLDGKVQSAGCYEGRGELSDAATHVELMLTKVWSPTTLVVDVGLVDGQWQIIEANATWGAGLNGCDAADVLNCIAAATQPRPA